MGGETSGILTQAYSPYLLQQNAGQSNFLVTKANTHFIPSFAANIDAFKLFPISLQDPDLQAT